MSVRWSCNALHNPCRIVDNMHKSLRRGTSNVDVHSIRQDYHVANAIRRYGNTTPSPDAMPANETRKRKTNAKHLNHFLYSLIFLRVVDLHWPQDWHLGHFPSHLHSQQQSSE